MKKRLLKLVFFALLITGFCKGYITTALAEETTGQGTDITTGDTAVDPSVGVTVTPTPTPIPVLNQIVITKMPSKLTYEKGEELQLSDMIVTGNYTDGSSSVIMDYQIVGYNKDLLGSQTIIVAYQNQITYLTVTVEPVAVKNVRVAYHDTTTISLTWDTIPNISTYEVYCLDSSTGTYSLVTSTYTNSVSFNYAPGTIHSYQICAVDNSMGYIVRTMSDTFTAATNPEGIPSLVVTTNGTWSISLAWNPIPNASGYLIYRSAANVENYVLCGNTEDTTFISKQLVSGKGYMYKVCAYTYDENYTGSFSNVIDTTTKPSAVKVQFKAGEGKIRFNWKKVNGATAYDIYAGDDVNGYQLFASIPAGGNNVTYIAEDLMTGVTYSFYTVTRKEYKGMVYESQASELLTIEIPELPPTSTTGKLFPTKEAFYNSWTYKTLTFFQTNVNYDKSFAIPGLITTNVGGFECNTMCPQAIVFAKNYLLVSAYDLNGIENSVIYVLNKKSKELLTTLVLPSKPHAGGLAYDGSNVWVTNGSKVSSILFSDIAAAAESGEAYVYVNYLTVCPLNLITSFVTYYDNRLWVGTYNELETSVLYSFTIGNKETSPTLTGSDTMVLPTRVQGLVFTSRGTLILSRSCQTNKYQRGFLHQLDTYKPDIKNAVKGVIALGECQNSVTMPSMNEDIAIDGTYLYVNFESAAFADSVLKMDRICAFKLTNVAKKSTK